MPKLKLLVAGIQRVLAFSTQQHPCLPITPLMLRQICDLWSLRAHKYSSIMLWAVCCTFFGFFRLGELTVPSVVSFNPAVHMNMSDVAVDNPSNP